MYIQMYGIVVFELILYKYNVYIYKYQNIKKYVFILVKMMYLNMQNLKIFLKYY